MSGEILVQNLCNPEILTNPKVVYILHRYTGALFHDFKVLGLYVIEFFLSIYFFRMPAEKSSVGSGPHGP